MSRRTFLIGGLGAAAVLSTATYTWLRKEGYEVDPGLDHVGESRPPVADLPAAPFDAQALAALTVLVDQLLPGDPALGLPNGSAAGVPAFLDRACRHRGLRPVRADVLKLCRDLNLRSRMKHRRSYAELAPEDRDALLAELRVDASRVGRYRPQQALRTTLRIALEGYLGHAQHGGNRDGAVWTALRIDMPRSTKGHQH